MNVRSSLSAVLLLTTFACDSNTPVTAEGTNKAATSAAPSASAKSAEAPKPTPSTSAATAPSGEPASPAVGGFELPKAANGVLTPAQSDAVLKTGQPAVVKVLDAGAEPREALAYDLKADSKQATEMRMNMEMGISAAGKAMPPTAIPELAIVLDLSNGKKNDAGEFPVTGVVSKVTTKATTETEKKLAAALEPALGAMRGLKITYLVSPKGRTRDVKVEAKGVDPNVKQMVDQMKQSFDSMVAPLPEEPVGKGAKWVVINRVNAGADILQFTTYTLKSKEGSALELDTDVKQFAASSALVTPQGPGGEITEFSSAGNGTSVFDLTKLAPEKGTGNVNGKLGINAPGLGAMTVDTKVKMSFGKPAP